ncbi:MAG: hypothetical protein JWQ90_5076, partial [Hydrocarboniphaga sp.]|nr:hypothetical protein [Hydrocarboniphaga sp.]
MSAIVHFKVPIADKVRSYRSA